ncbi:MAG: hypothetical protein LKG23_08525 [Nitrospira sp.]|nr:hypothetical protein [Nitrospira sp.]
MVELSSTAFLARLGEEAINELGLRASRCTVCEFIFKEPVFKEKIPRYEWPMLFDRFQLIDLPFERYVAGGILTHLLREVGPQNQKLSFPDKPVADDVLNEIIRAGTEEGLSALSKELRKEAALATKLAETGFRAIASGEHIQRVAEDAVPT